MNVDFALTNSGRLGEPFTGDQSENEHHADDARSPEQTLTIKRGSFVRAALVCLAVSCIGYAVFWRWEDKLVPRTDRRGDPIKVLGSRGRLAYAQVDTEVTGRRGLISLIGRIITTLAYLGLIGIVIFWLSPHISRVYHFLHTVQNQP